MQKTLKANNDEPDMTPQQQAEQMDEQIRGVDINLRRGVLLLGQMLNEFEGGEHYKHLHFSSMQEYLVARFHSRLPAARHAMKLVGQLTIPFDAAALQSPEALRLLRKLPVEEQRNPKWARLAQKLPEEKFEEAVRARIKDHPEQHIEVDAIRRFCVSEGTAKLWDTVVQMAQTINIAEGDGASLEKAIESLCEAFPGASNGNGMTNAEYYTKLKMAEANRKAADEQTRAARQQRERERVNKVVSFPKSKPRRRIKARGIRIGKR